MKKYNKEDLEVWKQFACAALNSKGGFRPQEMIKQACEVADKMLEELKKRTS